MAKTRLFSLADRIERICGRFLGAIGINPPKLTPEQWAQRSIRITQLSVSNSIRQKIRFFKIFSLISSRKLFASFSVNTIDFICLLNHHSFSPLQVVS